VEAKSPKPASLAKPPLDENPLLDEENESKPLLLVPVVVPVAKEEEPNPSAPPKALSTAELYSLINKHLPLKGL